MFELKLIRGYFYLTFNCKHFIDRKITRKIRKKISIWIYELAGEYELSLNLGLQWLRKSCQFICVSVRIWIPVIACSKFYVRKQLICEAVKPTDRKRINSNWERERKIYVFVAWMDLLRPFAKIYDLIPPAPRSNLAKTKQWGNEQEYLWKLLNAIANSKKNAFIMSLWKIAIAM